MHKKVVITASVLFVLPAAIYFSLKPNIPYSISVPDGLTVEQILDPFSNTKSEELYYLSNDKGYFNLKIENELNTKSISMFNSTGYKDMTTIKKSDLLSHLSKKIITVYYHKSEWYSFDGGDSCVAILQDNSGQNYIVGIYQIRLCK
jgi:hypothetical protein